MNDSPMNDISMNHDGEISARLRKLDGAVTPGFDYDGLLERHATKKARAARRLEGVRLSSGLVAVAVISAVLWRLTPQPGQTIQLVSAPVATEEEHRGYADEPSLVRADSYLAVAALEDHIASIDDELNEARLRSPRGVEVARLERTRADLVDSWSSMRYAEMVSTRF
jgi:hypothetical protein